MAFGVGNYGFSVGGNNYGYQARPNNSGQVTTQTQPGTVNFQGGQSTDDLIQQMNFLLSLRNKSGADSGLNYALYSPQEMAQRGLSMSGANRGALDAQNAYLDSQGNYIGRQAGANTLKNQLAGQDIAAKAAQAKLQAAQDKHSAQGQFAANGAISSEAARQALGSAPSAWKDTQPWMAGSGVPGMGGSVGDIEQGYRNTMGDLYRQLVGQQSDYDISQAGLYNQLMGLNATRAGLGPQYMQLDQNNDAYNRLLSGNYNTNVSPEMRALMAALGQAT